MIVTVNGRIMGRGPAWLVDRYRHLRDATHEDLRALELTPAPADRAARKARARAITLAHRGLRDIDSGFRLARAWWGASLLG